MTQFVVVRGDITTVPADVIVNAANPALAGGGGVDGAIHRAGGPSILEEGRAHVRRHGQLQPGHAAITGAGDLPARYVIHCVGPIYDEYRPEVAADKLASCYRNALSLAAEQGCRSVTFPNISTGVYGYPKDAAVEVVVPTVTDWCAAVPGAIDTVTFVCFDEENEKLYRAALASHEV